MAYDYNYIVEQNKKLRAQNPDAYDTPPPPDNQNNPAPVVNPGTPAPQAPNQPTQPGYTPPVADPNAGKNAQQRGVSLQQYVNDWRNTFGVHLRQSDPAGWNRLIQDLKTEGYNNVSLDTRADGMHKGLMIDGRFVKLADGNDNPIWDEGGGADGGGGGGFAAAIGPTPAAGPPELTEFQKQTRARIMEQLGKLSQPVTADDPVIASQMAGAKLQSDRSLDEERKALAERLAASGGGGGIGNNQLEQGIQTSRERVGTALAGQQGTLMAGELQSRRGSLQNLLALATQTGDAESARALQLQISQMDDAIRRLALTEQGREFDDNLGRGLSNDAEQRRQWWANFGTPA